LNPETPPFTGFDSNPTTYIVNFFMIINNLICITQGRVVKQKEGR
jgi:hypothetical protein